ncbi:capsular exopolysaccharide family domain protein [Synechococcus sp. RS9915]|nr:capsular exopolysaccharide family domain protein [Synechococcus sp. RS9915]
MTSPSQTLPPQQLDNDEIDLRQVAAALNRQRRLIGGITAAAVLLSGIYAFTRKPVWQGQFQIVLENQDSGGGGRLAQLAAANPMLAGLAGVSGGKSSLETEVKILESPSVLKPTYDFVKVSKAAAGEDVSKWVYTDWTKGNLDIELVKGTSVLSLAYRDTDEALILPVLERITTTYQEYSGKDRRRGLTQGVAYLEQEIDKLRQQSAASMRTAQAYALANGLGIQDGMPTGATGSTSGGSVEASREAAQNQVNALRQRIAAAQLSGNTTLYKAPQLEANTEIYSQLQRVETRLKQKSALLTPQDQSIQRLQRERSGLVAYINQQTIGLLQGELITAEAQLASLTRPREVVLKHRELVRAALRDEKTLAELEVQLQSLKLDQARQTDPWELISTPTVLDSPVAPRKKRMVALGLLGGLVLGCGAALIRDRRSGLVFSEDELKTFLPCPMLERLPAAAPEQWSSTAQLLTEGPLADAQSVALIPVGNHLPNNQIEKLQRALGEALGNRELLVSRDLLASRNCSTQLLVTAPGAPQRQQLRQLREQLALQGTPLAGWLLIDPSLEA